MCERTIRLERRRRARRLVRALKSAGMYEDTPRVLVPKGWDRIEPGFERIPDESVSGPTYHNQAETEAQTS